jgi:RNA polymerase sigma-70 factor, ECF subfamily
MMATGPRGRGAFPEAHDNVEAQVTATSSEVTPAAASSLALERASDSEAATQRSLEEFYLTYAPYMQTVLRRLGVAREDVEDISHDTFISVLRKLPEYDATRPMRPWLFGFAYRHASDYRKAVERRPKATSSEDLRDEAPLADAAMDDARKRVFLEQAFTLLDFDKRTILVMVELEGAGAADVAQLFSIPLNTAYSRIRLARAEFERIAKALTRRAP